MEAIAEEGQQAPVPSKSTENGDFRPVEEQIVQEDVMEQQVDTSLSIAKSVEVSSSGCQDKEDATITDPGVKSECHNEHTKSSQKKSIPTLDSHSKQESKALSVKKKDDDKLAIYKALAIKLKKELVKTREELQKLRSDYQNEVTILTEKLESGQQTLDSERLIFSNTTATQEATIKNLRQQLESVELELQTVQAEYENYKTRATEIMQKNNRVQLSVQSNKGFEEERYKQLKQLNDGYKQKISDLDGQLSMLTIANRNLERDTSNLRVKLEELQAKSSAQSLFEAEYDKLSKENDHLKAALTQYHQRLQIDVRQEATNRLVDKQEVCILDRPDAPAMDGQIRNLTNVDGSQRSALSGNSGYQNDGINSDSHVSPSASSVDSYVHIKPAALEIISRSSVLEDAQKQIDDLTKAYLDSESTNSLLIDQVAALKEEIRRCQRGTERLNLADNLEYLKNVVFKFLSLDNNQSEQKQRLVPVLSTVLRLSPEETAKLNLLATANRASMASALFKLG